MRSSRPMRCSTTDGFQGRSNSTRRRQNSKLRPSPPHSVDTSRLGPSASRNRATSVSRRAGGQLLVEDAGRQLRALAERRAQHLQRLAMRHEDQRLLLRRRASAAPATAATRGAGRRRPSPPPACAARLRRDRALRASAAPDASARRTRSIFCALARPRGPPRVLRTAVSTASRSCALRRLVERRSECPTRGGRPPMSARRVELVHGGSGVPLGEARLEAHVLRKLLRTQQLQQPEEPVRIVFERRRAEEQHVTAEAPRSARPRARPARRDGPADGGVAALRPRPADRCRRATAWSVSCGRSISISSAITARRCRSNGLKSAPKSRATSARRCASSSVNTWWYFRHSSPSHCTVSASGATTRQRSTLPACTSRFRISDASMVLPRPTSSASSQRTGSLALARSATWSWCGKSRTRPPRNEPRPSASRSASRCRMFEPRHEVLDIVEVAQREALEQRAFELQRPQRVRGLRPPVRELAASRRGAAPRSSSLRGWR